MGDKKEGPVEKLTREVNEKTPTEAMRDDLADKETNEAAESTRAEHDETEEELRSEESPEEAAQRHWKAGS